MLESPMPTFVEKATTFPQEGIVIEEYFGRIADGRANFSLGRLSSGQGWSEPAQRPEFDEFTVVLSGALHVKSEDGSVMVVRAGQAIWTHPGEKVQYSTPEPGGADYVSLCLPAFDINLAHRDTGQPE